MINRDIETNVGICRRIRASCGDVRASLFCFASFVIEKQGRSCSPAKFDVPLQNGIETNLTGQAYTVYKRNRVSTEELVSFQKISVKHLSN